MKQEKQEVFQEPLINSSNVRSTVSKKDSLIPSPDSLFLTDDPRTVSSSASLAPKYIIKSTPRDTLPPNDEDEKEKLTKKEKFSFALVVSGTILLMLGLGLAIYFLILIIQGASIYISMWYFIGALVLVGFLMREWGMLMKT